jgi:DNA-binding LacI/PurR family transcriptional regulator
LFFRKKGDILKPANKRGNFMTIKEIASALGISTSTVSKALNNATDVSEKTRRKVQEYADSVGFSFKNAGPQKRICMLFENMDSQSNLQVGYSVLTGFQHAANNFHYEVVVEHCTDTCAPNLKELCRDNNFIGVMVLGTKLTSDIIKQLEETDVPVMLMDSYVKNPKVSCISSDNINSISAIVEQLIEDGHVNIGFLGGEKSSLVSRERFAGYVTALNGANIEYNSNFVCYGNFTEEGGRSCAKHFIDNKVTAVVCASDIMAIGLIRGLKELGAKVPDDISVSGFDDLEIIRYFSPALTTVKQDFFMLGKTAFTILRQSIKGYETKRIILQAEPIFRKSTSKASNKNS